ncbi:hypothetical protein RND20_007960 [Providencia rettgeri]|nr:hypothetical protein [Providencia rettgeri]
MAIVDNDVVMLHGVNDAFLSLNFRGDLKANAIGMEWGGGVMG